MTMPPDEECEFTVEAHVCEHGAVVSLAATTDDGRVSLMSFGPEDAVTVARGLMKASWEASRL
jgi:hypothetical protein